MGLRDRNIEWARQIMYLSYGVWSGFDEDNTSGVTDAAGLNGGLPHTPITIQTVGTNAYSGCFISTSPSIIYHIMPFPLCWDIEEDIGFRVHYCPENAGVVTDDAVTWTVNYGLFAQKARLLDSSTALTTAITAVSGVTETDEAQLYSPRGIIAGGTFAKANLDGFIGLKLTCTFTTFASGLHFQGLAIDYVPKLTIGGNNNDIDEHITVVAQT